MQIPLSMKKMLMSMLSASILLGSSSFSFSAKADDATLLGLENDISNNVNWEEFMSRNDMLWDKMPTSYYDGPFIGNGVLGTIFWQENNSLHFEINRGDLYDRRNNDGAGYRMPNGYFNLEYNGEQTDPSSMRLDLWNAEVRGDIKTTEGTIKFRTFANTDNDVIVLEVEGIDGESDFGWKWTPRAARTGRPVASTDINYTPYPAQTQETAGDVNVSVQTMSSDAVYKTENLPEGQFATAWKIVDNGGGKKTIYISNKITRYSTDAKQQAIDCVNTAVQKGVTELETAHRQYWHEFYQKSFFSIPDGKAESFYWIQLYKAASATRANSEMMDLFGPWYTHSYWAGVWTDLNIQLQYSPFYASNHIEESKSLTDSLWKNRETLKNNAGTSHNEYDSYALARTTGITLKGGSGDEIGNLAYALNNSWQEYRYSMDDEMLREKLYPLMKGAFNYLNKFAYEGDDGKIHFPKTSSPEYPQKSADANYTLSLYKFLANCIIYANDRLQLNDKYVKKAQDVIDKLTSYPIDSSDPNKGFAVGSEVNFTQSHRHWSHLFMIYPLFEYTYDDPEQADIADKSIKHWQSLDSALTGYSYGVNVSFASMKGDRDRAYKDINTALEQIPQCNTMYLEDMMGALNPVIETPLYMARALQDTSLMGYNGIIRVFPGTPDEWEDVVFDNFLTDGGFSVSARRDGGKTQFIKITSNAGEPCKVKTDFTGEIKAKGSRDNFKLTDLGNGVTEIDLKKDEYVILYTDETTDFTVDKVDTTLNRNNYWGINNIPTLSNVSITGMSKDGTMKVGDKLTLNYTIDGLTGNDQSSVRWYYYSGDFVQDPNTIEKRGTAVSGGTGKTLTITEGMLNRIYRVDIIPKDDRGTGPRTIIKTDVITKAGTNLALNKAVTATSQLSGYAASNMTDGKSDTRWATTESAPQMIEIDLGNTTEFNQFVFNEFAYSGVPRITDYTIQYYNGADWVDCYKKGVVGEETDYSVLSSSSILRTVNFPAVSGSKVRFNINASTEQPTIWEIEIYNNKTSQLGMKIGSYVRLGRYNGVDLLWRVVDIDDNGPLLVLNEAIPKAVEYDAAADVVTGSHSRNNPNPSIGKDGVLETRIMKGSDFWNDSNIKDWLNSDKKDVFYSCGNKPSYSDISGFLSEFTLDEKTLLKSVTQPNLLSVLDKDTENVTGNESHAWQTSVSDVVQNYDITYKNTINDKIFLPDVKQIFTMYSNREILGEKYYQPKIDNNDVLGWVRTPVGGNNGNDVRIVSTDGSIGSSKANTTASKIYARPMMYIDEQNASIESGKGTLSEPYEFKLNSKVEAINDVTVSGDEVTVKLTPEFNNDAKVILCSYNSDGLITDVDISDVETGKSEYKFALAENTAKIKAFVWADFKTMMPYGNSFELILTK